MASEKQTTNIPDDGIVLWGRSSSDPESIEEVIVIGGAVSLYGLGPSSVRVPAASTYNSTEILGYRLLDKGTGDLIISPVSGVADVTITAAELTAQGDAAYKLESEHLDFLVTGAGMTALVYIP